ncbi:MAG: DUF4168 domain-containing protein [Microcystaceae cyanobacterium]
MKKPLLLVSCAGILFLAGSLSTRTLAQQPAPGSPSPVQQAPQGEISPEELQRFAKAVKQLRALDQTSQEKMAQAVQSEGFTPERFMEIERGQQNPQGQAAPEVSGEEKQKYEKALAQVKQIHLETQTQMQQAIKAEGLEVERFNEIVAAVQQDSTLQQQVQQMLKS